ncbi:MAG: hypothetical protein M0R75_03730 [Dehalococcoidia bacterium]|nr:hypothetical protein [Dehalococcoidia bacterium]
MTTSPLGSRLGAPIGLCAACTHAQRIESGRGSVFLRCARHDVDERFPKYARLPVTSCGGFEQKGV